MSEYSAVRSGKLKLKGVTKSKNKKSKRVQKTDGDADVAVDFNDAQQHGEWFQVSKFDQITGPVCIEFSPHQYVRALDNGKLILGAPHSPGEGPDQEEILVAVRVTPNQIALKSGYNKYLSVDSRRISGLADAIGPKEQFVPVFEDSKLALLASNECFLSIDDDDSDLPYLVARDHKVGPGQIVKIRTNINPEITRLEKLQKAVPEEEKGSLRDCEINYVKKFQSFQDRKVRLNANSTVELKQAQNQGKLHEALLDRRSKMKSDKFCK